MKNLNFKEWQADGRAWNAGVGGLAAHRGAAMQADFAYGEIARAAGRGLRRLVVLRGGHPVALAQIVGRKGLWSCARALVVSEAITPAEHRAVLRGLARRVPGVLMALPEEPVAGRGLVPLITARHHAVWPLHADEAALRAGLQGKWRNRLVRAEREGARVRQVSDPAWILAQEAGQQMQRGYRGLPPGFVAAWHAQGGGGAVLTLEAAGRGKTPQAGVVILCHGDSATYHAGWSGEQGRESGAHNLLLWKAALALRARGVRWFDLGEINSERGAGLMHFKLGTGAQIRKLGATLWSLPG